MRCLGCLVRSDLAGCAVLRAPWLAGEKHSRLAKVAWGRLGDEASDRDAYPDEDDVRCAPAGCAVAIWRRRNRARTRCACGCS